MQLLMSDTRSKGTTVENGLLALYNKQPEGPRSNETPVEVGM